MSFFALYSRRVVGSEEVGEATIVVKDGIIAEVNKGLNAGAAPELIDVGAQVIMPGLIDPHVHINEPGRTDWEGFETATLAAVTGGITTLVEMPLNASPVTTSVKAFKQKLEAAAGKLSCDCGFWGGLIPGNTGEIEPLIREGVLGFKAFLTHSGIDEFPNVTEADLEVAMPIIAKHGFPLLVHAELTDKPANVNHTNPRSYQEYLASRPAKWEEDAIAMIIRLCEKYQCRTHIVHLSAASAIPQIIAAKEKGLPLTVETAQHYLYFHAESIPDGNTAFKCAPPIREKVNNQQLLQALRDGIIDFVATDHSPAPPEMKQVETGDFMKAWGGIASVQFALPVLWTLTKDKGIGFEDITQWLSTKPSELAGLQQSKGLIKPGYQADLVVWDPEKSFTVTEDMIRHRHKLTPYLGEQLFGVVNQTYLAGELVWDATENLVTRQGKIILS